MKTILLTLLATVALASAADNEPKASFLDDLTISGVGAYQTEDWASGRSSWGAGVDVRLPINKFVSLGVRNLSFANNDHNVYDHKKGSVGSVGEDDWGGSVVDETAVYGRADFVKFAQEKLRLYGVGGASRHWELDTFSFHIGLGVEYRFNDRVSVGVAREIRAYFKEKTQDHLSVMALNWKF